MQPHYRGHAPHGPPRTGGQHVPQRRGGIGESLQVFLFLDCRRSTIATVWCHFRNVGCCHSTSPVGDGICSSFRRIYTCQLDPLTEEAPPARPPVISLLLGARAFRASLTKNTLIQWPLASCLLRFSFRDLPVERPAVVLSACPSSSRKIQPVRTLAPDFLPQDPPVHGLEAKRRNFESRASRKESKPRGIFIACVPSPDPPISISVTRRQ